MGARDSGERQVVAGRGGCATVEVAEWAFGTRGERQLEAGVRRGRSCYGASAWRASPPRVDALRPGALIGHASVMADAPRSQETGLVQRVLFLRWAASTPTTSRFRIGGMRTSDLSHAAPRNVRPPLRAAYAWRRQRRLPSSPLDSATGSTAMYDLTGA